MKLTLTCACLFTASALLFTTACGYSKSQHRRADAQAKATAAATAEKDAYSRYQVELEHINIEREKAGLAPRPILSFAEWRRMGAGK